MLGKFSALCKRVAAVLSLCFLSWWELKSKYLSVCVGFWSVGPYAFKNDQK